MVPRGLEIYGEGVAYVLLPDTDNFSWPQFLIYLHELNDALARNPGRLQIKHRLTSFNLNHKLPIISHVTHWIFASQRNPLDPPVKKVIPMYAGVLSNQKHMVSL